jgi:D-glycero-D-manno-heptose 1,7-bisphosphate phosphatase
MVKMSTYPPSVVFLDRDGVLIENVPTYVRSWEDVQIFDRSVEAVSRLTKLGVPIIVVTNQAGVGKGILSLQLVTSLNQRILSRIEEMGGGKFLSAAICTHHPDDDCDCRKPKPGMLLSEAKAYDLDLSNAVLVGDGLTDIQAAAAAGVRGVLVRTGRGEAQEKELASSKIVCPVFDDLLSAVEGRFGTD